MTLPIEVGDRFGYLEVVGESEARNGKRKVVVVRCRCGTEYQLLAQSLRSGSSRSCGCRKVETLKKRHTTHGLSKSSEYYTWAAMKDRCGNPKNKKYAYYGGRGVSVFPAWRGNDGFREFISHVGVKPTPDHELDRIDNDGNYEPGNVQWATRSQQTRNTRRNRMVEYDGRSWCVSELAEHCGLNRNTVVKRLNSGYPIDRVVAPVAAASSMGRRATQ